ncbi:hypothetical protein [Helicobacter mesocricetorum]|uniref:hypothetical protein n=1 Tax=Helicobacter mesocricetorum TaxID=87012 RepID=UPI000CF1B0AC|nr:hypothetical protein [Helicobacter mesocricetorum]
MRLLTILLLALLPNLILAAGKYPSPLPTPETEILNIDIQSCSKSCLKEYLQNGEFFSFLVNINKNNTNEELLTNAKILLTQLDITHIPYFLETQKSALIQIALLFPRKTIGRYSISSTNVILSYLFNRNQPFNFEIFDSKSESLEDLQNTMDKITAKGYKQIIALLTYVGANNINHLETKIPIYIPSVHSSQIAEPLMPNIIYGGISYEQQIEKLSALNPNSTKVVSFYDEGYIGNQMNEYVLKYNLDTLYSSAFNPESAAKFPKEIKTIQSLLKNSKIFLNTPITHSSIILSQITYNDIQINGIYSTQINYNPSFLSITQEKDRNNMYIANSIAKSDSLLVEETKLLNADLEYDWINYSTAYGVEYFYLQNIPNAKAYFKETIKNNQVEYKIDILTPKNNRFIPITNEY